jgi:hypothetical protein
MTEYSLYPFTRARSFETWSVKVDTALWDAWVDAHQSSDLDLAVEMKDAMAAVNQSSDKEKPLRLADAVCIARLGASQKSDQLKSWRVALMPLLRRGFIIRLLIYDGPRVVSFVNSPRYLEG